MELNLLGHEAVRQMVSAMLGYKPDGQPMWLLRTEDHLCAVREGLGSGLSGDACCRKNEPLQAHAL